MKTASERAAEVVERLRQRTASTEQAPLPFEVAEEVERAIVEVQAEGAVLKAAALALVASLPRCHLGGCEAPAAWTCWDGFRVCEACRGKSSREELEHQPPKPMAVSAPLRALLAALGDRGAGVEGTSDGE